MISTHYSIARRDLFIARLFYSFYYPETVRRRLAVDASLGIIIAGGVSTGGSYVTSSDGRRWLEIGAGGGIGAGAGAMAAVQAQTIRRNAKPGISIVDLYERQRPWNAEQELYRSGPISFHSSDQIAGALGLGAAVSSDTDRKSPRISDGYHGVTGVAVGVGMNVIEDTNNINLVITPFLKIAPFFLKLAGTLFDKLIATPSAKKMEWPYKKFWRNL